MIIKKDGKSCKCGNKGCFETYCSMKNLRLNLNEVVSLDEIKGSSFLNYLKDNLENEIIQKIIKEYIDNLIIGLSNITNLLEPECITLGGGFVYYKDILWDLLITEFNKANYLFNKENIPILTLAELGNDAGIIGASIDINKK